MPSWRRPARAVVIEADFDWSDLGTWGSVWEAADKDKAAERRRRRRSRSSRPRGNYVSSDRPTIGIVGLDDLIVVASDDVVLVAPRGAIRCGQGAGRRGQRQARAADRRPCPALSSLGLVPVARPRPGASGQAHRRQPGTASLAPEAPPPLGALDGGRRRGRGDHRRPGAHGLGPNESVYIPLGAVHRAANPGETPVTLIEVQCGDYLGEDDIIRFEDDYGRVAPSSTGPTDMAEPTSPKVAPARS